MLPELLDLSISRWHKREHYDYQKRIAHAILNALEAAQGGETIEIPIELPRQSGKTTAVVDTAEFILAAARRYLGLAPGIGIFAPQKEQATTDFDRLKNQFNDISKLGYSTRIKTKHDKGQVLIPEKWNSKTVRLFDSEGHYQGECYIFPISKTSKPESKTLHLIIIEEAQDVDDNILKNAVFPMGAATNAPRVYIGTAGTRNCYFKQQLDNNPNKIRITLDEVFKQRREMYERTQIADHLYYENYVNHEISLHGREDDYIQRQYFLKWIIGSGQFTTAEELDAMLVGRQLITENGPRKTKRGVQEAWPVYVGLDTAKHPDRTVCTVIRDNKDIGKGELCNWLTLQGDNYEDQFNTIKDWLRQYENIVKIAIDSTGQADFMPDLFENHTSYDVMRFKFGAETKDALYKNLKQVIVNKLTTIPNIAMDSNYRSWRHELLELEREYKGRFLSVHHPDNPKAHDDYPDSWALAEFAKSDYLANVPSLSFL